MEVTNKVIESKNNVRDSRFELLRIICMFLIVAHHYSIFSGFVFEEAISINKIWVQILSIGGKFGVNCFVLISAYFLCKQSNFKWNKTFYLIFQVTIISLIIYFVAILIGVEKFTITSFISALFPILFNEWWFVSTYFVFLLICPLLSKFVEKIDKKFHFKIILLFTIMWCIIPTFTTSHFEGNDLIWFSYLFLIASYLRKYPINKKNLNKPLILIAVVSYVLIILSIICFDVLGSKFNIFKEYSLYFIGQNRLPMLVLSLAVFVIFCNMPKFSNKFINLLASATLGVYLFHECRLRSVIWQDILRANLHSNFISIFLHSIASITIVFIVCSILSLMFNLIFDKILKKISNKLENILTKTYTKIFNKLF